MSAPNLASALAKLKAMKPEGAAAPAASSPLAASAALTARVAATAAPAPAPAPVQQPLLPAPVLPSSDALPKELADAVQSLATALHNTEPGIDQWLELIHEQLRACPELTHILSPEQVRAVCSGWLAKTQTAVVASASKARSGAKATKLTGKAPLSDGDL